MSARMSMEQTSSPTTMKGGRLSMVGVAASASVPGLDNMTAEALAPRMKFLIKKTSRRILTSNLKPSTAQRHSGLKWMLNGNHSQDLEVSVTA